MNRHYFTLLFTLMTVCPQTMAYNRVCMYLMAGAGYSGFTTFKAWHVKVVPAKDKKKAQYIWSNPVSHSSGSYSIGFERCWNVPASVNCVAAKIVPNGHMGEPLWCSVAQKKGYFQGPIEWVYFDHKPGTITFDAWGGVDESYCVVDGGSPTPNSRCFKNSPPT